jgi:hypothetical protein
MPDSNRRRVPHWFQTFTAFCAGDLETESSNAPVYETIFAGRKYAHGAHSPKGSSQRKATLQMT